MRPARQLAALNVLGVDIDASGQRPAGEQVRAINPPRSHSENPACDECAGFFICLGLAVPAGLLVWAAVIAALILK